MTRERDVERYLVERVRDAGGEAYKFTSPGRRGVPDRIVILPGWPPQFVELKAPGKKPTAMQAREHTRIRIAGGVVWTIDSIAAVGDFMAAYEHERS